MNENYIEIEEVNVNGGYLCKTKDNSLNYYMLRQVDFNGEIKYYDPIYVSNTYEDEPYLLKTIDLNGRTVKEDQPGIVIKIFSDGSYMKVFNK